MMQLEEYGIVIDFMPLGKATDAGRRPTCQLLGTSYFTLLEATVKPEAKMSIGEKVYVGKDARDKIDHIKGRITYDQLTTGARNELKNAIRAIIMTREAEFVNFFNKSGALTMRVNTLSLLPGIGKKHMTDIMAEREKKPFESMADIAARVALLPDPAHLIIQRVEQELQGNEKHYLFARPPANPDEQRRFY